MNINYQVWTLCFLVISFFASGLAHANTLTQIDQRIYTESIEGNGYVASKQLIEALRARIASISTSTNQQKPERENANWSWIYEGSQRLKIDEEILDTRLDLINRLERAPIQQGVSANTIRQIGDVLSSLSLILAIPDVPADQDPDYASLLKKDTKSLRDLKQKYVQLLDDSAGKLSRIIALPNEHKYLQGGKWKEVFRTKTEDNQSVVYWLLSKSQDALRIELMPMDKVNQLAEAYQKSLAPKPSEKKGNQGLALVFYFDQLSIKGNIPNLMEIGLDNHTNLIFLTQKVGQSIKEFNPNAKYLKLKEAKTKNTWISEDDNYLSIRPHNEKSKKKIGRVYLRYTGGKNSWANALKRNGSDDDPHWLLSNLSDRTEKSIISCMLDKRINKKVREDNYSCDKWPLKKSGQLNDVVNSSVDTHPFSEQ